MSTTPNPLIPQGSLQAKAARGASNVRIAVATIIAIHVVFFGGLLLQGCKRDTNTNANATATNETATATALTETPETNNSLTLPPINSGASLYTTNPAGVAESSNQLGAGALTNVPETGATQNTSSNQDFWTAGQQANTSAFGTTAEPAGPTHEYTVVKNDSYYKIAKANGTTIAALKAANPSIDPARIRPGMKLQIPARSASANSSTVANVSGNAGASTSGSGEGKVYTVKPGDTLTRIARQNGTTISAIRNANGMKTTRVNVGQKLKIPASAKSAPAVKEASTNTGLTY